MKRIELETWSLLGLISHQGFIAQNPTVTLASQSGPED